MKENEMAIGETKQVVVSAPLPNLPLSIIPSPDGNGSVALVREGYAIKQLEGPKAGKRFHIFSDIDSFSAWLLRYADPAVVEIVMGDWKAEALIDPASMEPEHVECSLALDPAYRAWSDLLATCAQQGPLAQKEFYDFVRGYRATVDEQDREALLSGLRVISISKGGELRSEIDETGAVRFTSATARREMTAKIPAEFKVSVPVFEGILGEAGEPLVYELPILLSVWIPEEPVTVPRFSVSCPQIQVVVRNARRDAAAMLRRQLGSAFLVGHGTLRHDTRRAGSVE